MRARHLALALIASFGLLAACTTGQPIAATPAPASTPSLSPSPSLAPSPSPAPTLTVNPAPAPAPFSAWSDPAAVDSLLLDCHAHAPVAAADAPDPLACQLPFDQVCAYDPCYSEQDSCRFRCSATCTSCDASCVQSCDACRLGCQDDVCRRTCAATAGACKQACLTSLDHCATGGCSPAAKTCWESEQDKWRTHKCSCQTLGRCTDACVASGTGSENDPKIRPCVAGCGRRFPGCDPWYCVSHSQPLPETDGGR